METLRETKPVARKRHRCDLCHGPIAPGDTYTRTTYVDDGR